MPAPRGAANRTTWRERAFVLGGPAVAALATAASPALGVGAGFIGALWVAAIAWTVLASLAGALRRGIRDGDWSAFGAHEPPTDDGEIDEWSSRTGRYGYLADTDERLLHDDGAVR